MIISQDTGEYEQRLPEEVVGPGLQVPPDPTWLPKDFQVVLVVKNLPANAGDMRPRFDPWVRKIPPEDGVAMPGESHGQMSRVGHNS